MATVRDHGLVVRCSVVIIVFRLYKLIMTGLYVFASANYFL